METKVCNRCGKEKPITEFCYRKKENVYRNPCKECRKKYMEEYANKHAKRLKEYRDNYYEDNRDKKIEYQANYRKEHYEEIKEKRKKYISSNWEKTKEYKKKYYKDNKEDILEKHKKYVLDNYEARREYRKKHFQENKERVNEYTRNRKKTDKLFKLKCQIRNMLWESFKRRDTIKNTRSNEVLGCDIKFFIDYLLKTYKDNYGEEWDGKTEIHIDHIIPLSIAKTKEEVIKLCNYTNLQLLKGQDNLKKSDKIDWKLKKGE